MHEVYPRARQDDYDNVVFPPIVVVETFTFPWGEVQLLVPERELARPPYSWEYWRTDRVHEEPPHGN